MEKQKIVVIGIIILLVIIIGLPQVFFILDETEQAVVVQMGEPVRVITMPGLNIKKPFIQNVVKFEKRLLEYDSAPAEILTKDKKNLVLDSYCRWSIIDAQKFLESVGTEARAHARLDDIVYAELRVQLGLNDLVDVISNVRETMMKKVTEASNQKAQRYGIEILDVRIKRADLPPENEKHVYGRMRAEREREAKKYRSEGEEEALKIRADTDKKKKIILSGAYKESQQIRGEGDAKAVKIYADAYTLDPDFYYFTRTLEAYKKSLPQSTSLVSSADNEFFEYLKGNYGNREQKQK